MKVKIYSTPEIELILLDSNISLILESEPPGGPGEDFGSLLFDPISQTNLQV